MNLGYRTDARPFSYRDEAGNAAGFSVAMCMEVVDALKAELGLPTLGVQWAPATFETVQQGKVDLLCAADVPTAARRQVVSFSIPIFPNGIGALVRTDASPDLRNALSGIKRTDPTWRASASALLSRQTFSFVANTAAEQWLRSKAGEFRLTSQLVPADGYETGARRVLDHAAGVMFGDRAMLLDAAARSAEPAKLMVLDRRFTQEPLALALGRGDEDFRLFVDRALSKLYRSLELNALYGKWFRAPDANALIFYQWMAVPE
ncbi:MAG TPA: amino acid ABC transporter substrate-binding protein [Gemmatimonadales bacterium]|nr:amino acid ABC transporter substrate-binding protein [Gemmatimonadales bacterium]